MGPSVKTEISLDLAEAKQFFVDAPAACEDRLKLVFANDRAQWCQSAYCFWQQTAWAFTNHAYAKLDFKSFVQFFHGAYFFKNGKLSTHDLHAIASDRVTQCFFRVGSGRSKNGK